MPKYTRYQDIPQFTRDGNWECDYTPESAVEFVEKAIKEDGLNLDPDFQRGHVWDENRQIAFLEFFFQGGKTARVLYFNHPRWQDGLTSNQFVIVDGKQRFEAFRRFVKNEIKVFDSYCREFEDRPRLHNSVKININNLKTREQVLRWYLEMNTGGVVHTAKEINRVKKLLEAELAE